MAEYIDLNNTEVLAEAGENAKLVVEEDGELKRIPASAVGQVKTVNGVEPDKTGDVGVSYNNLLDKPFGVESGRIIANAVDVEVPFGARLPVSYSEPLVVGNEYVVTVSGDTVSSEINGIPQTIVAEESYGTIGIEIDYGDSQLITIDYTSDAGVYLGNTGIDGVFSIRVETPETVKPLDVKFLPEDVVGSSSGVVKYINSVEPDVNGKINLSYEDLEHLPFEEGYEFTGVVTRAQVEVEYVPMANGYVGNYKFNDTFVPLVINDIYNVVWGGREFAGVTATENHLGQPMLTLVFDGPSTNYLYITSDSNNEVYNIDGFEEGTFELTINRRTSFVKPLDPKFLPTTVPVIQSATVGQTVVVKAVDESGKPTEWEAVDMSVGGGEYKYIVEYEEENNFVSGTKTNQLPIWNDMWDAIQSGKLVFILYQNRLIPMTYKSISADTGAQYASCQFHLSFANNATTLRCIAITLSGMETFAPENNVMDVTFTNAT